MPKTQKMPLNEGRNVITAQKAGIAYIALDQAAAAGEMWVEYVAGGRIMPRFVLGTHTSSQWSEMVAAYADAPYVELVGKHMMLTFLMNHASLVDDAEALMTLWDQLVVWGHEQYGITAGNLFPHAPDPHRYHFVEDPVTTTLMYCWNYRMATQSNEASLVFNARNLRLHGLEPMHELGHTQQLQTMSLAKDTEVTVDLTPNYLDRKLGNQPRYERQGAWPRVFAWLALPTRTYESATEEVRRCLYWQLDLTFGPDFYARLGTHYRNLRSTELPSGDTAEKQRFIIETSRVAGYDLTPYFSQWGYPPDSATAATLKSLGLRALTQPIWLNRDNDVKYRLY